ncbi:hypothetical protein [Micromonospora avicenniae]|uniref:Uncharacterized protein n=1 Tax=Micromonospora avicenniae TaxID=1198245 RepID=A0A1N7FS13_9ACTN|nr:hypothetical protein [Micromonospora avicenniae]SIS03064.1 hypothetical protein SAMN05444858_1465 [Micromonospora avicenniae]
MTDKDLAERIRRARGRDQTPGRIGKHAVLIDTVRLPAGVVTTVHRVLDGQVTVLRASADSFRDDIAEVLLDVPPVAAGSIQPTSVSLPGVRLDHALVLGPGVGSNRDPELNERTVTVVAVHHGEILAGEAEKDFHRAISSRGTGLGHHLNDWNRHPVLRADARLLDDWPGGVMRPSRKPYPWHAERILSRVVSNGPADVRFEIRSTGGHNLVLQRQWDRAVGTLTFPDGASTPVDQPRHDLWASLSPIFLGEDASTLVTVTAGMPEADVLEMRYQTHDRGWASLPVMEGLDSCVARLDGQILRTPGNWAVFTSRSDAAIQAKCTDDGHLWLETPDPAAKRSQGRLVTVEEAATLLHILAREDRSAMADLPGVKTVPWD